VYLGLAVAIGWQAGEFEKRTGIRCKVNVDPEDLVLDSELSTAIFRIFQETLTNITRHAEATKIAVHLRRNAKGIELAVRDNGKGITEEQLKKPDSFGLLGIRERTHYWGGDVQITGKRDRGTIVKISIPVREKENKGRNE
jgi:signal transduction histidine kinase